MLESMKNLGSREGKQADLKVKSLSVGRSSSVLQGQNKIVKKEENDENDIVLEDFDEDFTSP